MGELPAGERDIEVQEKAAQNTALGSQGLLGSVTGRACNLERGTPALWTVSQGKVVRDGHAPSGFLRWVDARMVSGSAFCQAVCGHSIYLATSLCPPTAQRVWATITSCPSGHCPHCFLSTPVSATSLPFHLSTLQPVSTPE